MKKNNKNLIFEDDDNKARLASSFDPLNFIQSTNALFAFGRSFNRGSDETFIMEAIERLLNTVFGTRESENFSLNSYHWLRPA